MEEYYENEYKAKLFDMFKWFHSFCEENNIRYYALGGTMLGAVRHQGMIPWDDDIDVGMPREDYNRFISLLVDLQQRYVLESPLSEAKEYTYLYSKLYDTSTTLVEKNRFYVKRGLFIDIFPLDGTGDTEEESNKRFQKIRNRMMVHVARTTNYRKGRGLLKNIAGFAARLIPNFLFPLKAEQKKINDMCNDKAFYECKYGGNIFGHWGLKEIMPISIMGTPQLYRFESFYVYGVEHYDEYLSRLYGDWRALPPIEKRKTIHDFIECDLSKGYLVYRATEK